MNKTKEVFTTLAADVLTALALCGPAAAVFAPRPAFSAPDPEISATTQWGDVRPTNSLWSVLSGAGFAPTGYVHEVASQAIAPLTDAVGAAQRTAEAAATTNAQQAAAIAELAGATSALNDTKFDRSGGEMTGVIYGIRSSSDTNRTVNLSKIGLAPAGTNRKGAGKLGVCMSLQNNKEASLYIDDDGKVYVNTPNGYVEVPDATSGGTLSLTAGEGHTGNLAALDAAGNPTDSGKSAADFLSAAPLAGRTYDFATTQGVMDALAAVIATLGGAVTNNPSITAE